MKVAINDLFREAAKSRRYQGILGVSEDPIVSADIVQDPLSWPEGTVQFDRTREAIETAPGYDPSRELTGADRRVLERHYGLGHWKDAGGDRSK